MRLAALSVALTLVACLKESSDDRPTKAAVSAAAASASGLPVIAPAATQADDGQWTMPQKDYANSRYSSLAEITPENAKNLKIAFTFSTGILRGHEAPPLVVNNTMYVVTPFPNYLYALDLTKEGAPTKWRYDPKPSASAQGVACCDVVNRGAVYSDGKIIYNTLDGHTVAVDAKDGHEVWNTKVAEINLGESITMAPLVAKGKVFVGNSGGEFGVRGFLAALDEGSGKIAWRAYNTGPDSEVLIGPQFKPYYSQDKGKDLGVKTWPGDAWRTGGASVWGWLAYDPELDLVYYGTGNPGPWNPDQRPGDNKWASGIFARRPSDGQAVWYYQWSYHDMFDYDGINEQVLLDMQVGGQTRKVLVRAERNGYVYVLDRATGEVLSATPFGFVNSSKGVDLKTGRLIYSMDKEPKLGQVTRNICPSSPGMKDWQPTAYSPRTGLLYIPHQNLCMDHEAVEANYIAGTPYVGMIAKFYAGPGGNRGVFQAWDVVNRKEVWSIPEKFPVWSGTLVTAGDVAFYGTMDGWFKAVTAKTGAPLWKFKTGSGIIGQ
ncbi:MAG: PQQ-dependent dehydrogenase, methanol/ethanol family, partial [Gemmatimonadaceae bacterium]|nr:PQQ-dependent dehydrogenase, methanol/ethanol family [Gemmatimonadaceae bacterium]